MATFDITKYIQEQGSQEPVSSIMSPDSAEQTDKMTDFYKRFSQSIYDSFEDKTDFVKKFGPKVAPTTGVNWDEVRRYTRDADMKDAIESSISEALGILEEPTPEPQGVTLVDVTDTEEGKLTNPEPLQELMEDLTEEKITKEELPPAGGIMSPRLDEKGKGPEKKEVLRPKLRPEGLDSLEEKERVKAVQTIIGTKADGAFGRNSKAKLKAWQYVHNIPTTGEIDEATMAAMKNPDTYDPREIGRDDFMLSKTFDLLKGVEGFEENAYLGAISDKYKSGLTVGAGIDFGQHTKESLLAKGLPKSLVEKAEAAGWIGLNPDTVIDPETGQPASQGRGNKAQRRARGKALLEAKVAEQKEAGTFPQFTYEELAASTPVMYSDYEKAAKSEYERQYGEGTWAELNEGAKAVLSTEKYHRGVNYTLPENMLAGARTNNAAEAARGIADRGRRNNMTAWLKKVGLS